MTENTAVRNENIAATKFVEKSTAQIKDTSEKMGTAAEHTTKMLENTFTTATRGIREFNLKALEIARTNSDAAFDCARQLMGATSPSEMMELWASHARKRFEAITEQTQELTTLGQKVAGETAQPLASGVAKASKVS